MHGISFGFTNLAHGRGPMLGLSDHHGVARSHRDDVNENKPSLRPSPGSVLANLGHSIADLRSQLESLSSSRDLPADGPVSASAMGATLINKQRGELQIHTLEGDVVTLKFSSKVGISIEGRQVSDGNSTLTGASLEIHSREKLKISVDGDLNETELAAITDLVDKVGDLTSDFFSGNMEAALSQAMSLSYDTRVLADYSLDLSLKQSVRAYAYAAAWAPPKQVELPAEEPVEPVTEVIDATPAPTNEAAAVAPVQAGDTDAAAPPSDTTTATNAASPADVNPTHIVADFVAKVRSSLRMTATDAALGMSYDFKVKLLISSIGASAPANAQPENATLDYLQQQLGTQTAA